MDNTYSILDKDHWEVMQMDPDKKYSPTWGAKMRVWGFGFFWMQTYVQRRKFDEDTERYILWGE